jgi:hypothetical protein
MQLLFDGTVHSHHSQCYITIGDSYDISTDHSKGQVNGLLGAAFPSFLYICIGWHTGDVRMRVELHPCPAPLDPKWEEVVEVPFTVPEGERLVLSECCGGAPATFRIPGGDYRVRYCANQFGVNEDRSWDEIQAQPLLEEYLLCFWPAARRPDEILKVTRPRAQYWHSTAPGRLR